MDALYMIKYNWIEPEINMKPVILKTFLSDSLTSFIKESINVCGLTPSVERII